MNAFQRGLTPVRLARQVVPVVVAIALNLAPWTPALAAERVLEQVFPAATLDAVALESGSGSVSVVVGHDDTITVRVAVSPEKWSDDEPWKRIKSWFLTSAYDDIDDLMGAIQIETEGSHTGRLRLGLAPPIRARESRVREDWQITVPARLAIKLAMARADLDVEGVAGGVDISVGNGSVEVDVPGGDLDITVTVGNARVRAASQSVRRVNVETQVGDARLWMNGLKITAPAPPGPGNRVKLSGDGNDVIRVYVQVGDAILRVNEP